EVIGILVRRHPFAGRYPSPAQLGANEVLITLTRRPGDELPRVVLVLAGLLDRPRPRVQPARTLGQLDRCLDIADLAGDRRALTVQRPGRRCRVIPHRDLARLQVGEALGETGQCGPDLPVRAHQIDIELCRVGETRAVHLRVPVLVEPGPTERVHYRRQRSEYLPPTRLPAQTD